MRLYFVGLDVHKQVIAYCVKTRTGEIVSEGNIRATLDEWVGTLPGPWHRGLEATMFSHWIYEHLKTPRPVPGNGTLGLHEGDQRGQEEER